VDKCPYGVFESIIWGSKRNLIRNDDIEEEGLSIEENKGGSGSGFLISFYNETSTTVSIRLFPFHVVSFSKAADKACFMPLMDSIYERDAQAH